MAQQWLDALSLFERHVSHTMNAARKGAKGKANSENCEVHILGGVALKGQRRELQADCQAHQEAEKPRAASNIILSSLH